MNIKHPELDGLKARLVSTKDVLVTAIRAADFAVEIKSHGLDGKWPKHALIMRHASLPESAFERTITVELGYSQYGRSADKVVVNYMGNRRLRRYSTPVGLETKIVANLKSDLATATVSHASHSQYLADQKAGAEKRANDLKGMVMPPGMTANIISGNGPGAGFYRIDFSHYGGDSILTTDLTVVQVQMIADLLNNIQHSREKFVLAAAMPETDGRVFYWKLNDWSNAQHITHPQLFTRAEADAVLANATAKAPHAATVKILAYTSIATV